VDQVRQIQPRENSEGVMTESLALIIGVIVGLMISYGRRPKHRPPVDDQASKLRALCKFGQGDFTREYPRKG